MIKFYAFDFDDNIMRVPSMIYMKNSNNETIPLTTEQFAQKRDNFKELGLKFFDDSFIDFRDEGNEKFLKAIETGNPAKAMDDFVECVNNAMIFAIITARGHSRKTLKEAIKKLIKLHKFGLDENKIKHNLNFLGFKSIDDYLDSCKFYPTTSFEFDAYFGTYDKTVEEKKTIAMRDFVRYCRIYSKNPSIIEKFGEEKALGFSDDDIKNVYNMEKFLQQYNLDDFNKVSVKFTGEN